MEAISPRQDLFVSVVVYAGNTADIVESFTIDLENVLAKRYTDYEIIFVDDVPDTQTRLVIGDLLRRHDGLRYLCLSRRFGLEVSVYAGMHSAIGDYVVTMSMQTDPPDAIPEMVDRVVRQGGILFGVCDRRLDERGLFRLVKAIFLTVSIHLFRIPLQKNATRFMVISRQALNALLEIKDRYQHVRVFTAYIGYIQESYPYRQINRGGSVVRRPLGESIAAGTQIILSNSSWPLRGVAWAAILAALVNLALAILAGPGQASVPAAVALLALSGVLAMLGEYITTLTEETRNRPLYYVHEERNSSVLMADSGRINVIS